MKHLRLSLRSLIIGGLSAGGGSVASTTLEPLLTTGGHSMSLSALIGAAAGLWIAEKLDGIIAPDEPDKD